MEIHNQLNPTWETNNESKYNIDIQHKTLENLNEHSKLAKFTEKLHEHPEASLLLQFIENSILEMENNWLIEDSNIMKKTKQRFVLYVKNFVELNKNTKLDSIPDRKKLDKFSNIIPIAQKGGESGWMVYKPGQWIYFNQFKSAQLPSILENEKTKDKQPWEIINFLLSKEWEKVLLKQFPDENSFRKSHFSWVDIVAKNRYLSWVKLVIDNSMLEKGKRIFFSLDHEFLEKLKSIDQHT